MRAFKPLALVVALMAVGCGASPNLPAATSETGFEALGAVKALRPELPRGEKERPVVLLSYLPIDDGLDFHIPFYLNTLERTTSEKIYNVAFTDARGPGNTLAHLIQPDQSDKVVSPSAIPAPGVSEMTTNKPETLASVMAWAYGSYPARFKALSYLGHGGGFMGIATDATPAAGDKGKGLMTVADFGQGLKQGLRGRKLDLVHLHACLMANVEAAYELRDVAEVLFASEDVIGANQIGTEKPTEILNTLLQQPNPDARAIARETAIRVNPSQNPYGYATASAIDLARIAEVKTAVNVLARDLIAALPAHRAEIERAYKAVPEFANLKYSGQRDLWTFCKALLKVEDAAVQKDAQAVTAAMRKALLHTRDQEKDSANGLSIFMPDPTTLMMNRDDYATSRFAKDTLWDEFLTKLLAS